MEECDVMPLVLECYGLGIVNGKSSSFWGNMILQPTRIYTTITISTSSPSPPPHHSITITTTKPQFNKFNNISSMTPNLSIPKVITQHFPT
jgi:hypothetical protein